MIMWRTTCCTSKERKKERRNASCFKKPHVAFTVILLKDTNVTMDFLSSVSPGSLKDECHNFIKVLLQQNEDTLFVCGTNAFNPSCRTYKVGMPAGAHTHTHINSPFGALCRFASPQWRGFITHIVRMQLLKLLFTPGMRMRLGWVIVIGSHFPFL